MKKLILIGLGILLPLLNYAQVDPNAFGFYVDALRFSTTRPTGSARIMGIGGANVALGADISTIYSNPAGLGLFNRSTFSLTPAYSINKINTDFLNTSNSNTENTFNFFNAGLAISKVKNDLESDSPFLGGSFGFSVTRVDDFNGNYFYSGVNPENSIIDSWIEQSDGQTTDQFTGNDIKSLAYFDYLIGPETVFDPNGSPVTYFTDILGVPEQSESVLTEGSQYQWSVGYGANFDDRIYLGASLGLTSMNYTQSTIYRESFENEPIFDLTLEETLRMNGTGINGTFGLIIRPLDQMRLGLSVVTPTAWSVDDEYQARLSANWDNFFYGDLISGDTLLNGEITSETDLFLSNYRVTSPTRLSAGVAYFIGKSGFITADLEFVNHGRTKMRADFDLTGDNNTIQNVYTNALNLRLGGEFRLDPLRIRVGYANYGSPFADSAEGSSLSTFTAGLGFRVKAFSADLAYVNGGQQRNRTPYLLANAANPQVDLNANLQTVMLSLGFNF